MKIKDPACHNYYKIRCSQAKKEKNNFIISKRNAIAIRQSVHFPFPRVPGNHKPAPVSTNLLRILDRSQKWSPKYVNSGDWLLSMFSRFIYVVRTSLLFIAD